jgi:hypothetical protein
MRKRHHKKRISGVRRRRHSKMSGIDTTNILGVVAGAVVAGYLNKLVGNKVNDKVLAGGKVALGIALPMLFKSGSSKNIIAGVGSGMIAVGSVDLLKSFGALSGDFDIPVINGDFDIPVINGDDEFGADILNGDEDGMGADFLSGDDDGMGADFLSGEDDF